MRASLPDFHDGRHRVALIVRAHEGLRIAYVGLPPDEIAAMAGGNAARVYGFDLAALDRIAATVGPAVEGIAEPLTEVPADATRPGFAPGGSVRVW